MPRCPNLEGLAPRNLRDSLIWEDGDRETFTDTSPGPTDLPKILKLIDVQKGVNGERSNSARVKLQHDTLVSSWVGKWHQNAHTPNDLVLDSYALPCVSLLLPNFTYQPHFSPGRG